MATSARIDKSWPNALMCRRVPYISDRGSGILSTDNQTEAAVPGNQEQNLYRRSAEHSYVKHVPGTEHGKLTYEPCDAVPESVQSPGTV